MMSNTNDSFTDAPDSEITTLDFDQAISQRYLSYALSSIMSRSLPDVRDGLKPVHRRILYSMLKLNLNPKQGYKKCARVVGDVIGKYHPHGDGAVYDTLVRLAQDFSLRYPLIDGQGNFGSIDGDNAAAMRYTESKLTPISLLLMDDLDYDTVEFAPTYDDSDNEPILFPAKFPNLLANGSEGIAVGMATSIPPHNLAELCQALDYMIKNRANNVQISDLMNFIKGPDMPTGGIIIENHQTIKNIYESGKGSLRLRCRWRKEDLKLGQYVIVITEIPYQVQKSKLIEQIAILLKDKKLPLILDIRDESAEDIRIVIEPKSRTCDASAIMESLFKQTALESRINVNMNVLSSSTAPRVMNLQEMLHEFLQHRKSVVISRTKFKLAKIFDRLEILEALRIAYLNIDLVIQIVREEDEPKEVLMEKFQINEVQAEAILNIKLKVLRKLEEQKINDEHQNLITEQAELNLILTEDTKLWSIISEEIAAIKKQYDFSTIIGSRKTSIEEALLDHINLDISAFVEKEPLTITCSSMGWIKAQRGHNLDLSNVKYKEGDDAKFIIECSSTDSLLLLSSNGKMFTILADSITKGKGQGDSIKLIIDLGSNNYLIDIETYLPEDQWLIATKQGKGLIVYSKDIFAQTKVGKQIINLSEGDECLLMRKVIGDSVAVIGSNRKLLVFDISEVPTQKRGSGVILQKYRLAELSDLKIFTKEQGLSWDLGSKVRVEEKINLWQARRGSVGKMPPAQFPKNNKFFQNLVNLRKQ